MSRREQYVEQDRAEMLRIDKILNENNQMFMDINKKKKEGEKAQMIDMINKSMEIQDNIDLLKVQQNWNKRRKWSMHKYELRVD